MSKRQRSNFTFWHPLCKYIGLDFIFSEIGNGWGPAILNTLDELYFIKEGQKSFCNSVSYWIGGSTNSQLNITLDYSDHL